MSYYLTTLPTNVDLTVFNKIQEAVGPMDIIAGPWLAGGAVRRLLDGTDISEGDFDFFFADYGTLCDVEKRLAEFGAERTEKTSMAVSYKLAIDSVFYKIQLIRRQHYHDAYAVLKDFDFTVCQFATDGKFLATYSDSMKDLEDKTLRISDAGKINDTNFLRRIIKYVRYGFLPNTTLLSEAVEYKLARTSSYDIMSTENNYDWKGDPEDKFVVDENPSEDMPPEVVKNKFELLMATLNNRKAMIYVAS